MWSSRAAFGVGGRDGGGAGNAWRLLLLEGGERRRHAGRVGLASRHLVSRVRALLFGRNGTGWVHLDGRNITSAGQR